MKFSIQINVAETPEEALERILEDFHKFERGEKYVASQLGVLNWDEFYALFSPKGLMHVESFVKSHNGIWPELILDCQPLVTNDQNSNISVSKLKEFDPADYNNDAEDVMLYLRNILAENDPVALADALKVIFRADGINKLIGNSEPNSTAQKVPTLKEMLAQCDLSADPSPDSDIFENMPPKGQEDI